MTTQPKEQATTASSLGAPLTRVRCSLCDSLLQVQLALRDTHASLNNAIDLLIAAEQGTPSAHYLARLFVYSSLCLSVAATYSPSPALTPVSGPIVADDTGDRWYAVIVGRHPGVYNGSYVNTFPPFYSHLINFLAIG